MTCKRFIYVKMMIVLEAIIIILTYRRKTTKSLRLTRPVRTTKKKSDGSHDDDGDADKDADEDADKDADKDADEDADGDGDGDSTVDEDNTDWLDDLKMDPQFAEDQDLDLATGTPMDLETFSFSERWSPTEPTMISLTTPTSTTLMDLNFIGFNDTWCSYIDKAEKRNLEGKEFIDLVKKLCSGNHSEDNDVRLALRHTIESRRLIDRLMNDIVDRLAGNNEEMKKKLLKSKHKVTPINQFCYQRIYKSFKYFCIDPEQNPYMQRYLNVMSNACRRPELTVDIIRDQLVEACESINSNLVDVV